MKEVSEKSVRNFEEEIGTAGAALNIQKQTSGENVKLHGVVTKGGKEVAFASRDEDGAIVVSIKKPALLSAREFREVFAKVGACFAELLGIEDGAAAEAE